MSPKKTGRTSFARLLELSKKFAAEYHNGDLSKVEVYEEDDAYVVVVLPPDAPASAPKPPARKKTPAAPAAPDNGQPETERDGMKVTYLPPVLPKQPRKRAAKKSPVRVAEAPPPPGPGVEIPPAEEALAPSAPGDDAPLDLSASAYALTQQMQDGLPNQLQVEWHPDVLATSGVIPEICEAVIRHPQSVTITPETAEKGYPVLEFRTGDIRVILGFRDLHRPMCIAAYPTGDAFRNYQQNKMRTGGGGKRKESGPPRTVPTLVSRIRDLGCLVPDLASIKEDAAPVTYEGQALGKISIKNGQTRPQIEAEWNRVYRKVDAIKRKALTSA